MAMMTGKEYVESLRAMNLRVYMFGKRVENPVDDPILRPSVNSVRMTYDLAQGPNYKALMTATSHLTGETINRFTHIHPHAALFRSSTALRRPVRNPIQQGLVIRRC